LYSKNDSFNEDNTILQEDPKAAPLETANIEALTVDAAKDDLLCIGARTSKRQKKP